MRPPSSEMVGMDDDGALCTPSSFKLLVQAVQLKRPTAKMPPHIFPEKLN